MCGTVITIDSQQRRRHILWLINDIESESRSRHLKAAVASEDWAYVFDRLPDDTMQRIVNFTLTAYVDDYGNPIPRIIP